MPRGVCRSRIRALNWVLSSSADLTRRSRASVCTCPFRPKFRFPALRREGRAGNSAHLSRAPHREQPEQSERWQAHLQTDPSARPIRPSVSARDSLRDDLPGSPGQCARIPQTALRRHRTGERERRTRLPPQEHRHVRAQLLRISPPCGRQLPKDRRISA